MPSPLKSPALAAGSISASADEPSMRTIPGVFLARLIVRLPAVERITQIEPALSRPRAVMS